jgi:hypothetical protein
LEITHLTSAALPTETAPETNVNKAKCNIGDFAVELEKALGVNKTSKGYAYIDKYGFSHVVKAYETALQFVKPETEIYGYNGDFQGGYATDVKDGGRIALPIPGSVAYGNEAEKRRGKEMQEQTASASASVMPLTAFLEKYPGYLSLLPVIDRGITGFSPFADDFSIPMAQHS